jgi:UDP-glucose 4-epimerase
VEHEPLHIFGDGQQSRDFTFVSDIVGANLRAATSDAAVGETFNIAGGARTTLREVLDLLREISGAQIEYVCEQRQRGDVQDTLADTSRAAHLLGYAPQISLREGLVRQFASIVDLYRAIPGRMVA